MIHIEAVIYVRIQELAGRAPPMPLESGFIEDNAYRALGIYSPSETSECYFVLANDRDETWFISNRHLRIVGVFPTRVELRFRLKAPASLLVSQRATSEAGAAHAVV